MKPVTTIWRKFWLNRLASVAVLLGRNGWALSLIERVVALDPQDVSARSALGNLRAEAGDRAGAIREFESLLQIKPDHSVSWFNLGFVYEQAEQLDDAERCFRRALALDPKIDRAWYGLGLVLIRAGRLEDAIDALKQNIKLQPFSPYGYYQLGMTYHHLRQPEQARRIADDLQRFEPKYAATLRRDMQRTPPHGGCAQEAVQQGTHTTSSSFKGAVAPSL